MPPSPILQATLDSIRPLSPAHLESVYFGPSDGGRSRRLENLGADLASEYPHRAGEQEDCEPRGRALSPSQLASTSHPLSVRASSAARALPFACIDRRPARLARPPLRVRQGCKPVPVRLKNCIALHLSQQWARPRALCRHLPVARSRELALGAVHDPGYGSWRCGSNPSGLRTG